MINIRLIWHVLKSANHSSHASWIESIRPVVLSVSLGARGVDSRTMLEKVLEIWECWGQWCLRKKGWPWEWLSDAPEMICENVLSSVLGGLMRRETCCDPDADKNLTTTNISSAFSFSEYIEREGREQTGLSSELKSRGIFCSLSFFESWSGRGQLAN